MNKRKKSIKDIVNHYRVHFKYESFLDTQKVARMLQRNGHNPKLADIVAERSLRRAGIKR